MRDPPQDLVFPDPHHHLGLRLLLTYEYHKKCHVGAGKTITFCTLARILNCRTLVLVHREQLLDQTVNGFRKAWPEATVGVVQGKRDDHLDK